MLRTRSCHLGAQLLDPQARQSVIKLRDGLALLDERADVGDPNDLARNDTSDPSVVTTDDRPRRPAVDAERLHAYRADLDRRVLRDGIGSATGARKGNADQAHRNA